MIRILHIVSDLQPSGTTTQLKLLASGLPRDKFELCVAALNGGGPGAADLQSSGVDVAVIGRRWTIDPLAFQRLRQHIARLQPQIAHTWQFEANTYGRIAAKRAGIKHLISSERSIDHGKVDLQWVIDRRLTRHTQQIVVNSTAVRDFCVAHGLPADKFLMIPGAAAAPAASSMSRSELLATLSLSADAQLIAYIGQLTKYKRLKELIWAIDQLKAVGTVAHLLIVGQGPLRSQLERYSRLNQIESRVHFLGVRNDVPQLLPRLDVLWQPGDCEGQSSAILEAMAAGIPVVAADAAGNRELIIPSETGFLVPLAERAGFARATLPILEDATLRSQLSVAARERVNRRHCLDDMLAAYTRLYDTVWR